MGSLYANATAWSPNPSHGVTTFGHGKPVTFGQLDPSQTWTEASKQADFSGGNGVAYGAEATLLGSFFVTAGGEDVASSLAAWSSDPATNNGWVFKSTAGNRCWASSDNANPALRPRLTVTFTPPTPQSQIADLGVDVQVLPLDAGDAQTLRDKLDSAILKLDGGKDDQAVKKLEDLVKDGALLQVEADPFIAAAEAVITAIESG